MSKMDTWFRKHDPRKPKDPSVLFAFRDGTPLAILRPADAERTMRGLDAIAEGTPHEIAKPAMDALLTEQPHKFVGYLSRKGEVLDEWGRIIGQPEPGDSLCGCGPGMELAPPMFMRTGTFHKEVWDGRTVVVLPRPDLSMDSSTGIIVAAPDQKDLGSVALRGGIKEPDCHIPTLNWMLTGARDKPWNAAQGGV